MILSFLKNYAPPALLKKNGVLSMNSRNHDYIMKYNQRRYFPSVDDKLLTKELAEKAGVPSAELIGAIRRTHEADSFDEMTRSSADGFVIKPGHGSGGRGILVIRKRESESFIKNDGTVLKHEEIRRTILNILSGLYSLGGQTDYALIEKRIDFSKIFEPFSFQGIPDVRIIVFRGYPAMAMMRLATRRSDGRANLHQGAVGVGLSIRSGYPLNAVQFNRPVTRHPDTGAMLADLRIPFWREHLLLAARCADIIKLGYFGADIVIDKVRGPLLLELNARPGLAIQLANHAGLKTRLQKIESLPSPEALSAEERISLVRDLW